jgi:hypothetical protein
MQDNEGRIYNFLQAREVTDNVMTHPDTSNAALQQFAGRPLPLRIGPASSPIRLAGSQYSSRLRPPSAPATLAMNAPMSMEKNV